MSQGRGAFPSSAVPVKVSCEEAVIGETVPVPVASGGRPDVAPGRPPSLPARDTPTLHIELSAPPMKLTHRWVLAAGQGARNGSADPRTHGVRTGPVDGMLLAGSSAIVRHRACGRLRVGARPCVRHGGGNGSGRDSEERPSVPAPMSSGTQRAPHMTVGWTPPTAEGRGGGQTHQGGAWCARQKRSVPVVSTTSR